MMKNTEEKRKLMKLFSGYDAFGNNNNKKLKSRKSPSLYDNPSSSLVKQHTLALTFIVAQLTLVEALSSTSINHHHY